MTERTKEYVDSLFAGYENTASLADFKEEIRSNLDEKIETLKKKGVEGEAAFAKATLELGDISALAEELSMKKRQEVFADAYLENRRYMSGKRVGLYVTFAVVLMFGLITALLAYFGSKLSWVNAVESFLPWTIDMTLVSAFGAFMPFFVIAVGGFTYLGMTQESAAVFPLGWKRAAWYTAAAVLLSFGVSVSPVIFFSTGEAGVVAMIAALIPFFLPGGGLLAYLVLTEKSRFKPWMQKRVTEQVQREMEVMTDPATATRFGLYSGAIWILAAAVFVTLGFAAHGWAWSWVAFVFATGVQLLVQASMIQPLKKDKAD